MFFREEGSSIEKPSMTIRPDKNDKPPMKLGLNDPENLGVDWEFKTDREKELVKLIMHMIKNSRGGKSYYSRQLIKIMEV